MITGRKLRVSSCIIIIKYDTIVLFSRGPQLFLTYYTIVSFRVGFNTEEGECFIEIGDDADELWCGTTVD